MSTAEKRRYPLKECLEFERQGRPVGAILNGEHFTVEEYLAFERAAEWKYEYLEGEIREMPHSSRWHCMIVGNLVCSLITDSLSERWNVLISRMRLKVVATGLYTFPDVVVVSDPELEDENRDTLLNPTLIVEVLSESSEAYDRREKFAHYQKIPTLEEYALVSHNTYRVEVYTREHDDRWIYSYTDGLEGSVFFRSIDAF
jgi:Uma2 family endonuclease